MSYENVLRILNERGIAYTLEITLADVVGVTDATRVSICKDI